MDEEDRDRWQYSAVHTDGHHVQTFTLVGRTGHRPGAVAPVCATWQPSFVRPPPTLLRLPCIGRPRMNKRRDRRVWLPKAEDYPVVIFVAAVFDPGFDQHSTLPCPMFEDIWVCPSAWSIRKEPVCPKETFLSKPPSQKVDEFSGRDSDGIVGSRRAPEMRHPSLPPTAAEQIRCIEGVVDWNRQTFKGLEDVSFPCLWYLFLCKWIEVGSDAKVSPHSVSPLQDCMRADDAHTADGAVLSEELMDDEINTE
jgi:hypothetical protein